MKSKGNGNQRIFRNISQPLSYCALSKTILSCNFINRHHKPTPQNPSELCWRT